MTYPKSVFTLNVHQLYWITILSLGACIIINNLSLYALCRWDSKHHSQTRLCIDFPMKYYHSSIRWNSHPIKAFSAVPWYDLCQQDKDWSLTILQAMSRWRPTKRYLLYHTNILIIIWKQLKMELWLWRYELRAWHMDQKVKGRLQSQYMQRYCSGGHGGPT
jgi:hypothetical protein